MRTLKKPVLSYFANLVSPSNPRNRPTGKRIVDMASLRDCRAYAGSRTRTPGMIPVEEPWDFRGTSIEGSQPPSSNRVVFSACYRPQIRVNITPTRVQDEAFQRCSPRVRKPVPGSRCLSSSLRGAIVRFENSRSGPGKHASYSLKPASPGWEEKRVRKDHPLITARMRRGSDVGSLLKAQWDCQRSPLSSRSTACTP